MQEDDELNKHCFTCKHLGISDTNIATVLLNRTAVVPMICNHPKDTSDEPPNDRVTADYNYLKVHCGACEHE